MTLTLTTEPEIAEFCAAAMRHEFCTVDTEFLWDRAYLPALSLVQVATPEAVAVVDALAVGGGGLAELMGYERVIKVIHSASHDIPLLESYTGKPPRPLFDSQVAAALTGLRAQLGYADFVRLYLDVELDKTQQVTDWLMRPLTPRQLDYAAADVSHLACAYPKLRDQLAATGRLAWALEDSARVAPAFDPAGVDPATAYQFIGGAQRLHGVRLHRLRELARWREAHARATDERPRRIVADALLLAVARAGHVSTDMLRNLSHRDARRARKVLPKLEEVLVSAERCKAESPPPLRTGHAPSSEEERLAKIACRFVAGQARELGVEAPVLEPRAEVDELAYRVARGDDTGKARLLTGWRREVVGEALVETIREAGDAGPESARHGHSPVEKGRLPWGFG